VPKKKTSHSRKAMRAANKGLKDKQSVLFSHWLCCYIHTPYRYRQLPWLRQSQAFSPPLCQLLLVSQPDVEGEEQGGYPRLFIAPRLPVRSDPQTLRTLNIVISDSPSSLGLP
jgi:ribosomal protein L32